MQQINNTWISSDGHHHEWPPQKPHMLFPLSNLLSTAKMKTCDFRLILKFVKLYIATYMDKQACQHDKRKLFFLFHLISG
jgi:hypothetical protein